MSNFKRNILPAWFSMLIFTICIIFITQDLILLELSGTGEWQNLIKKTHPAFLFWTYLSLIVTLTLVFCAAWSLIRKRWKDSDRNME